MAERPESWRSHRCHDCGRRSSRSRCSDCRTALEERKLLANDPRAVARKRRREMAQHQTPRPSGRWAQPR